MNDRQGEPLIIQSSHPQHCFATWDRVLINLWRGDMELEAATHLQSVVDRFVRTNDGQSLAALSIIASTAPAPPERVRVRLASAYRSLEAAGVRHVWVAEGGSSRSALMLSVGLTLSAAPALPLQLKFAASVHEAAEMIAPCLSRASGRATVLKSIVEQVRWHSGDPPTA
ncbi:MAG: hypothetical protein EOO73_01695 [Myxococcales bacterium]|nr:MAG: hypothetical protein EOO73_01695 [Myxococcales bacterium]